MTYFLTVRTRNDQLLHHHKRFPSLNDALQFISSEFYTDSTIPWRWAGYFALHDGEITWLKMKHTIAGFHLRNDIADIDVLSARGLMERGLITNETIPT